jgi:DHA1 family bicyclomycin/chloramphenicol resistance-like MFS transporter
MMTSRTPPHIITLVTTAALGPLAMNVFLPSLPAITTYFETTPSTVQLSVSLYLATVALLQLVFGPLSDKFGRRPVILLAFAIMIIGTLMCIFASSIEWFLAGRVIQAASSAGLVLSRAIARDLKEGADAAVLIAYITMGMSLAPMIGPLIGGYLDEIYGWQSSFYLTLGFAVFALFLIYFDLGETNKHKQNSLKEQINGYPELLTSRRFWGYSATAMFSSGAFFAFLGGGSILANKAYDLSPSQYGFYFMFISLGYLLGNMISGRITKRIGINRMMLSGNITVALGLLASIMTIYLGSMHPASFFGFIFFVGIGNGMTLPSANAGVVNVRPSLAGSASGLAGSMQLGGGAILSVIAGYMITLESNAIPLAAMMFISVLFALASTLYVMQVESRIQAENNANND